MRRRSASTVAGSGAADEAVAERSERNISRRVGAFSQPHSVISVRKLATASTRGTGQPSMSAPPLLVFSVFVRASQVGLDVPAPVELGRRGRASGSRLGEERAEVREPGGQAADTVFGTQVTDLRSQIGHEHRVRTVRGNAGQALPRTAAAGSCDTAGVAQDAARWNRTVPAGVQRSPVVPPAAAGAVLPVAGTPPASSSRSAPDQFVEAAAGLRSAGGRSTCEATPAASLDLAEPEAPRRRRQKRRQVGFERAAGQVAPETGELAGHQIVTARRAASRDHQERSGTAASTAGIASRSGQRQFGPASADSGQRARNARAAAVS